MKQLSFKEREYTILPGRIRVELFGIKENRDYCQKFIDIFSSIEGVLVAKANETTGKVLLQYNPSIVTLEVLSLYLQKFEEVLLKKLLPYEENTEQEAEVAVSMDASARQETYLQPVPVIQNEKEHAPPLNLTLAVTGAGALGVKQLLWGRSAIARHPLPFYISGVLAIGTGYSFFRRGVEHLSDRKRAAVDFVLGASSLALGLLRENLVVLMGMSLLQYLNWKRQSQVNELVNDTDTFEDPDAERYAKKMGRLGMLVAGVGLAVTRNPLVGLSMLLAANPRPATTGAQYTWKQTEYMAEETGQMRPQNGSMKQLAEVKTVIFDHPAVLFDNGTLKKEVATFLDVLPATTEISFFHHHPDYQVEEVTNKLKQEGWQVVDKNEIQASKREELLYVVQDNGFVSNKVVSFYPTVTISQLPRLKESYEKAMKVKNMVKGQIRVTNVWNVTGTACAVPFAQSAPLINLIADGITLAFLVRAKRKTEKVFQKLCVKEGHQLQTVQPWHTFESEEVLTQLKTDIHAGLKDTKIKKRMKKYGKNQLKPKERPHWLKDYVGQLKEFTTIILGATAVISLISGHFIDGIAMSSILLLNAGISTIQERKTQQTVEMMTKFVPPRCQVIRNGETKELSAEELVPGDIVMIEAGDRVPADLRVVQSWNLEVDESALTGESLPVVKGNRRVEAEIPISDRSNMLYMGTHITRGRAKAVVCHTGNETEIGHLFQMLSEDTNEITPLQKQVTEISKTFMKGALAIGGIVFLAGFIRGIPVAEMIPSTLALTASSIPEGLPVTITVALTAGILRMAKKNSLTRKISSLETLGRVTVVCSDKTGTLTKNEMTVKKVATAIDEWDVTGDGYSPEGVVVHTKDETVTNHPELEKLMRIGLLCSNSELLKENNRWTIKGDPTEGALLTLAAKQEMTKESHTSWKRKHELPFDSDRGLMSVVCHEIEDECFLMTKGSVEKVLSYCKYYEKNGRKLKLTKPIKDKILAKTDEYAEQSLRTLGFAYRPLDEGEQCVDDMERDLIYIGMVGMIDPPKEDVAKSIKEAMALGVQPVMITGDHPKTALAIAKQIGMNVGPDNILTGVQLDQLSEEELATKISSISVYARVTPDHKLKIVKALQNKGEIVAMTGDGVNDSLAIKQADVGIAMGQTGTQVTKETADIVLKEDHFGGIVEGVKEGRTIIGNIRKALGCLLCGNLAEIIVTSTAVIAGLPLPIVPIQILLMNLITDALPAMVLAVNPGDKSQQTKRQEIADKQLYKQVITRGVLLGIGSVGVFAFGLRAGMNLLAAQTMAFSTLVVGQLIQTFSWRQLDSEEKVTDWSKDKFLVTALGGSFIALALSIYVPPLATIFKTEALALPMWAVIFGVAGSSALLARPITGIFNKQSSVETKPLALAV